jgi:hypothetical protein
MGRHRIDSSQQMAPSKNNRQLHVIWRGVGFGLMVLIPVMSYALARLFLDENIKQGWITFPQNMYLRNTPLPQDLLILILIMLILMLIMYAIYTLFSLIIFRMFAPPRYGPLDVPPITYKGKQYKR